MPIALFLISALVSVSMFVSASRIVQDSQVNQLLLASSRAVYASESSSQLAWHKVRPDRGAEVIGDFYENTSALDGSDISNEGRVVDKRLLQESILSLSEADQIELQIGDRVKNVRSKLSAQADAFVKEYFETSIDFFFQDVTPYQQFEKFVIDFCDVDASCPSLIVEKFVITKSGSMIEFDTLEGLRDNPFLNPYQHSAIDREVLANVAGVDSPYRNSLGQPVYQKRYVIENLDFNNQNKDHLVRFRSQDGSYFRFQVQAQNSSGDLCEIPNTVFEVDDISSSDDSFRRVRQQRRFFGGLQPGLEYVYSADKMVDK